MKCHNVKVILYLGGLTAADTKTSVVYKPTCCRQLYSTEAVIRTMVEPGTYCFQALYSVINALLLLGVVVTV